MYTVTGVKLKHIWIFFRKTNIFRLLGFIGVVGVAVRFIGVVIYL